MRQKENDKYRSVDNIRRVKFIKMWSCGEQEYDHLNTFILKSYTQPCTVIFLYIKKRFDIGFKRRV